MSYVDDIFKGGATFDQTLQLKTKLSELGYATTAEANLEKWGPCQQLKNLRHDI